jgi:hypothetical protein
MIGRASTPSDWINALLHVKKGDDVAFTVNIDECMRSNVFLGSTSFTASYHLHKSK